MSVEQKQRKILSRFLTKAARTEYGKRFHFDSVQSYEEYKAKIPLTIYSDYAEEFKKIKRGEASITWPGSTTNFGMTAGSTGDPKIIPLFEDRIKSDVSFTRRVIRDYLLQRPNFDVLTGSHLSIPGNLKTPEDMPGTLVGEVSAHLARRGPKWLKKYQLLKSEEVVFMDLSEKLAVAVERSMKKDVRVIYALPSWTLKFLHMALKANNVDTIDKIWPKLRVFVTGGESLASCKQQILKACGSIKPDFIENYGSSEGFYSYTKKLNADFMKLVYDGGVFFEFIENPPSNLDELKKQSTVPLWEVEKDKIYSLVVTSNSGLWRYCMTDTIVFTDSENPHIRFHGRVTDVVDKFGESLSLYQIDQVMKKTAKAHNAEYIAYTVGASLQNVQNHPKHYWFVHWATPPSNIVAFAADLDQEMIRINHSYEIRRGTKAIGMPEVISMSQEQKDEWMSKNYRIGAQTKFPRIIHEEQKLLALLSKCVPKIA